MFIVLSTDGFKKRWTFFALALENHVETIQNSQPYVFLIHPVFSQNFTHKQRSGHPHNFQTPNDRW